MSAAAAAELVQGGYDSRSGAARMPAALQSSPQTEAQREFVRAFVAQVHTAASRSRQGDG